jgi:hypothetical protein
VASSSYVSGCDCSSVSSSAFAMADYRRRV